MPGWRRAILRLRGSAAKMHGAGVQVCTVPRWDRYYQPTAYKADLTGMLKGFDPVYQCAASVKKKGFTQIPGMHAKHADRRDRLPVGSVLLRVLFASSASGWRFLVIFLVNEDAGGGVTRLRYGHFVTFPVFICGSVASVCIRVHPVFHFFAAVCAVLLRACGTRVTVPVDREARFRICKKQKLDTKTKCTPNAVD